MNILDRMDPTPNRLRGRKKPPFHQRHPGTVLIVVGTLAVAVLAGWSYRAGTEQDQRDMQLADYFAAKYEAETVGFRIEYLPGDGQIYGRIYAIETDRVLIWVVDGTERTCTVAGPDTDDPSLICDGVELPLAGG